MIEKDTSNGGQTLSPIADDAISWRGKAPVAPGFDDVYYSADDGLAETEYVFLGGTGLPDAWAGRDRFVIAETGFGTGLNFLATWKAWIAAGRPCDLTFISVEGYPLSRRALAEAHRTFPDIADLSPHLIEAWPAPAPGFHERRFEGGRLRLLLLFGDVVPSFQALQADVDAWFLDGFAPAKNPAMWSDAVMDQIARLSHPGTRFATFTAAGVVKRALQARGFEVIKGKGYGRKRDRLLGTAIAPAPLTPSVVQAPEWASLPAARREGRIAIIGGGVAGAFLARDLKARGRDVTLVTDPATPAASALPAAILAPKLPLEDSPASRFMAAAFLAAVSDPDVIACMAKARGTELMPIDAATKDRLAALQAYLNWGQDRTSKNEAGGLTFTEGGSVDATALLVRLTEGIPRLEAKVERLERTITGWRLIGTDGSVITEAETVVVAAGPASGDILGEHALDLRPNRGQIEIVADAALSGVPTHSLTFGGYLTAAIGGERTLGSSFERLDATAREAAPPRDSDRAAILQTANDAGLRVDASTKTRSWSGLRATVPDHLPYAGPVPDWAAMERQFAPLANDANTTGLGPAPLQPGLFLLTGLGSKGFQYGPLAARYIAAIINGDPLPLPADQIARVHPARHLIRQIIRRT
ncbi:FAD-dependent 5-carboxymethylaminomethyl-2-thiouridine(34) oxidoreductase MnmC [Pseudokordiimonas caeni]|uniref:FAD-dependent 5-carboxymethylaminomethyl-2-thiouridine(34) oxidoreductase MnmC n=1 Tax=Pseudokordiimonas caeni TaxID=2997908 RepID=UPI0028114D01|nr:FAD-dependent 5-carboxymethylaminomethyl-2-thiouridine(34) oxidoreductase MnmC [Pseudokordiimonas caeni]